ncbi:MAG: putative porin [Parabacteroides sp.]|nr:putative porin [Parabacteroides sp.]
MKHCLYIIFLLIISISTLQAQQSGGEGKRFSLSNLSKANEEIPDSLLIPDSTSVDNKRLKAYRLTPLLGEPYLAPLDTHKLNFANSTLVESNSLAVGYLTNTGSAAQTRIFSERKEARDFIFADVYDYYITDPLNAEFYDTKVPYTHVMYTTAGGSNNKNERLKGTLTMNFGPKINVGGDLDYIYSRGHYKNNGNKLLSYRLFGSYKSDRYELHAYLNNFNFINYENGGLANDSVITHPDEYFAGDRNMNDPKSFNIRYNTKAWNRVRGKQYFLTHRYNLGFEKELEEKKDSLGNPIKIFVPVSSIIHTLEYQDNRRRFRTEDNTDLNSCYLNPYGEPRVFGLEPCIIEKNGHTISVVDDRTSWWNLKNTFGLSLREGFQDWVKFGLTAFVTFDKRKFQLPAAIPGLSYDPEFGSGLYPNPSTSNFPIKQIYDEFSTYIGAEISKRKGNILTYNARGELCVVGDDIGEFRATGNLQTRFQLFNKEATISADAYIKNVTPAFYLRHFHSRYFWWDNPDLNMTQQIYAGAKINLESTRTQLSAGVESIQNFIFINKQGMPKQKSGNLQVINARIKQDFMYRAFGWENEVAYQLSSDKSALPLPQISLYTNMYVHFKIAKVLTVQLGANMYYNTAYYAPYYEPATQQFQTQDKVKVGNYPLINAYANFHLKQARFFVMGYNLSSKFVDPNYFSLPHYPLDPFVLKMGVAVTFNN